MEDRSGKIILVTGATGKQGGAAAERLIRDGWGVKAFTRDPDKESSRHLERIGAQIVKGDLDDPDSVRRAVSGAFGVFSVQNFWETGHDREVAQGVTLAEAAADAGVRHFVYSSVGSADEDTGLIHFESKWKIERRIKELGLPATILRPVFFMENFNSDDFRIQIAAGAFKMPMRPDRRLQMISVSDIGALTALAFADPGKYLGKSLDIAGDEPTMREVAENFSEVMGSPVHYEEIPLAEVEKANPELGKMFRWFNEKGYRADIAGLRRMHPGLLPFRIWVETAWIKSEQLAESGEGA